MKKLLYIIPLVIFLSSCKIFAPSQMLRTKADFKYSEFSQDQAVQEYKIAPFDKITFSVISNNGEKLVDQVGGSSGAPLLTANAGNSYTVEYDGMVKFPVFGRVKISGYTIKEAEKMLEEMYSKYINDPFVRLEVSNMRVILFSDGLSGSASVVNLPNPNTTLFEALASSGGVLGGKAYNIKIIRGDLKNPQVFLVDLSTLEGMKKANLILQANDIIVIKPRNRISERVTNFIAPYLTLASLILLIVKTVK